MPKQEGPTSWQTRPGPEDQPQTGASLSVAHMEGHGGHNEPADKVMGLSRRRKSYDTTEKASGRSSSAMSLRSRPCRGLGTLSWTLNRQDNFPAGASD
jgi:hypothetical protein